MLDWGGCEEGVVVESMVVGFGCAGGMVGKSEGCKSRVFDADGLLN